MSDNLPEGLLAGVEIKQGPSEQDLERIKQNLYFATLEQLKKTVLLVAGLVGLGLAVFGWVSWATVRQDVVGAAAVGLQGDSILREQLLSRVDVDTASAHARVREIVADMDDLKGYVASLKEETGRAAASIQPRLNEIDLMLTQLLAEIRAKR